jgi:hypothetical protein
MLNHTGPLMPKNGDKTVGGGRNFEKNEPTKMNIQVHAGNNMGGVQSPKSKQPQGVSPYHLGTPNGRLGGTYPGPENKIQNFISISKNSTANKIDMKRGFDVSDSRKIKQLKLDLNARRQTEQPAEKEKQAKFTQKSSLSIENKKPSTNNIDLIVKSKIDAQAKTKKTIQDLIPKSLNGQTQDLIVPNRQSFLQSEAQDPLGPCKPTQGKKSSQSFLGDKFELTPKHQNYYTHILKTTLKGLPLRERSLVRAHFLNSLQAIMFRTMNYPNNILPKLDRSKIIELPPSKKKLIIFDLDETLIHCKDSNIQNCMIRTPVTFSNGATITVKNIYPKPIGGDQCATLYHGAAQLPER